jgi:hypothetical protein
MNKPSEESGRHEIMEIDDTIQTLAKVRQSTDSWVAQTTTRPDALIADLNDLYVASTENRSLDELFEHRDVAVLPSRFASTLTWTSTSRSTTGCSHARDLYFGGLFC